MCWRPLLLLSLFLSAACGPPLIERSTWVRFNSESDDFWALPFPSDLRQQADDTYDLKEWPGDWSSSLVQTWLRAADERLTNGWGLSSGIFVQMSGAIDPASLPVDIEASMRKYSTVFLVDVDPDSPERGRRFPLEVSFHPTGDSYAPNNLLAAIPAPGFVRRAKTIYALVITDGLRDPDGVRIGRSRPFHRAFEETDDPDARAVANLRPLRGTLGKEGFDFGRIAGAAVFTTMDPSATLVRLADWAESLPSPTLSSAWAVAEEYESYQVLNGRYDVPVIQTGNRPYARYGEGKIDWGEDGLPIIREKQSVRLALTIPKQPQPPDGFPLTIYMHGSGGEWYQAINRGPRPEVPLAEADLPVAGTGPAEWLARRGVATITFEFPLHGDRHFPPDTNGLLLYNILGNIDATIDNFDVAAMEILLLSRLVTTVTVDPALASTLNAGAALDGLIRFDPNRLTAFGQSMGTTIGIPAATVDPRIKGYLFSGTGGSLINIALKAREPFEIKPVLEIALNMAPGAELHRAHPILHALQNLWDRVDPSVKARRISVEPRPGLAPRDVMMIAGFRDGYFDPYAQAFVAVPLGATLVGEEVEPFLPEMLALSGQTTSPYPLTRNLNARTVGVVRYSAPHDLGHYVIFNQEGARHQYTCFLASVGRRGGAAISAPGALDDPCPALPER